MKPPLLSTKVFEPSSPKDLPSQAPEGYPIPWTYHCQGNGHYGIYDKDGTYLAHIYCWDQNEWNLLQERLDCINGISKEERASLEKEENKRNDLLKEVFQIYDKMFGDSIKEYKKVRKWRNEKIEELGKTPKEYEDEKGLEEYLLFLKTYVERYIYVGNNTD